MGNLHCVHSRGGRIGHGADTQPADIDAIVAALRSDSRRHLIVHFHGGLVSKAAGLAQAERLAGVYSPTPIVGGYPVFFVWESGAWETIRNNITELADEPVFKQLLRKILQYVLERIGIGLPGARGAGATGSAADLAETALSTFWAAPSAATIPFRGGAVTVTGAGARSAAALVDEGEIQADLEGDTALLAALATLPDIPPHTRSALTGGPAVERRTKFSEMVSSEFSVDRQTRGLVEVVMVAAYLARVVTKVIRRFAAHRDHGLYATCVEEALRGFKVGGSGVHEWAQALEWNRMKKDTADAFGGDPDVHAGTAFLHRLGQAMTSGLELERITLVGHSTGAIFIAQWLDASVSMLPQGVRQDLVFLAPAISYDLFADTIRQRAATIGRFRMFAMRDQFERDDQVWGQDESLPNVCDWRRFLYPSSLLYLVSGVLEERRTPTGGLAQEADVPLLGMERFFRDPDGVYSGPGFETVDAVRAWLGQQRSPVVWSMTSNQPGGLASDSIDHGGFNVDPPTLGSLSHIVQVGFE